MSKKNISKSSSSCLWIHQNCNPFPRVNPNQVNQKCLLIIIIVRRRRIAPRPPPMAYKVEEVVVVVAAVKLVATAIPVIIPLAATKPLEPHLTMITKQQLVVQPVYQGQSKFEKCSCCCFFHICLFYYILIYSLSLLFMFII